MKLFRRRTDEVFSTLQQVQRRLSQNTQDAEALQRSSVSSVPSHVTQVGDPEARVHTGLPEVTQVGSTGTVRPVGEAPAPAARPRPEERKFRLQKGDNSVPSHVRRSDLYERPDGAAGDLPHREDGLRVDESGAGPRRGVQVGPEVMGFLVILWVFSVVLAYVIGTRTGDPAPDEDTDARYANERQEKEENGDGSPGQPASPRGDYILVLMSAKRSSPSIERIYAEEGRKLNALLEAARDKGYRPWCGIRRLNDGGIQFVYGKVGPDTYGVDRDSPTSRKLFAELKKKRYSDAFWSRLTRP